MNEWEQDAVNKIARKLGPGWTPCVKCGETTKFQAWPSPVLLVQQVNDTPASSSPAISAFAKACKSCGFVELYCIDAIDAD